MNTDELIQAGTVVEAKAEQSLVKVDVLGRVTDWLPLLQQANSFKRGFSSVRVGQQVVVLANRYVLGSIFNADCLEPNGSNEHIDITEYEDGTVIQYDSEAKELMINCVGDIRVTAVNATVEADSVTVTAGDINLSAADIALNGDIALSGSEGVITTASMCPFTQLPHSDGSSTVKAGM